MDLTIQFTAVEAVEWIELMQKEGVTMTQAFDELKTGLLGVTTSLNDLAQRVAAIEAKGTGMPAAEVTDLLGRIAQLKGDIEAMGLGAGSPPPTAR